MGKIVLDANVACEFPGGTPEATAITAWLLQKGSLATGGNNLYELAIVSKVGLFIQQLVKAGRAFTVDSDELQKCEAKIVLMTPRSNDAHVIALALVSGARILLYSRNTALIRDFKDRKFLTQPRGKCYLSVQKHSHLLR